MLLQEPPLNNLFAIVLGIALVYGALALYLYVMQPGMLYYPDMPSRDIGSTPSAIGLAYESVELKTSDGVRIHAWFVPATAARGTLLFAHGNAGNISHRLDSIETFHELGLNVMIFDYRGYGKSSGKPSERGTYRDADAVWDYLVQERGIPPRQIVIFGRSLGAAVAADLASRKRSGAVILESAFTSVPDMGAALYPWLPVRWLSRFRYDSKEKVRRIHSPVLVIHSRGDEIIPYSHGQRLFALANEPRQFLELQGGHNDGYQISRRAYVRTLDEFLSRYLR